jgi:hypothetical protein
VSWLAPDDEATCQLHEAARECASLLASSFSFRGYALRNEVAAVPRPVRRCSVRHLLAASLVHVTDELPPPAELVLRAAMEDDGARVTLEVRQTDGDKGFVNEPAYRAIRWDDVLALAEAEGAQASRDDASGAVRLLLPWAG